ncbi:MAG TPA: VWA domain-containing protein [Blastocatellia bacterium]|nr:VWA domain-containing protein [Blastocatellia bacterium]
MAGTKRPASFSIITIMLGLGLISCAGVPVGAMSLPRTPAHRNRPFSVNREQDQKKESQQKESDSQESDGGQIRLNATLVQVPAIITDPQGKFVTNLVRDDFKVFEDGKPQQIGTFATVEQPFNVVLVLDTSNSAEDRLKAIHSTAIRFLRQIGPEDHAMVINFDDDVHVLTEFTSDHKELEDAISETQSGYGKLLYEAVNKALDELRDVEGRRAVVLFTDGIDLGSVEASAKSTQELAEEIGAVIYSVQFNTRWWVESEARKQQAEHPVSNSPFPTDGRMPLPPGGPGSTGPNGPKIEVEGQGGISIKVTDANAPEDIGKTLDKLYGTADLYLNTLATVSGGKLFDARTFEDSDSAFAAIARELRSQYVLGYYPAANHRDGKLHKIKLEVNKKGLKVRARQGYRAAAATQDQ